MTLALLLLAQAPGALPPVFTMNDAGWEAVETDGEVTVERRDVPGSACAEFRATATSPVPVDELCAVIFDWASLKPHGELKLRSLLKEGALERVVYDQIEMPIISNRDYAMTVRRSPPGAEVCRVWFWATAGVTPTRPGLVRIDKLWGSWELTQVGGHTQARYTLFVDPGGSLPAFLATSGQKRSTIDTLRNGLEAGKAAAR